MVGLIPSLGAEVMTHHDLAMVVNVGVPFW
jgi:hypothetical protein